MTVSTFHSFPPNLRNFSCAFLLISVCRNRFSFFLVDIWRWKGSQFWQALTLYLCMCPLCTYRVLLWIGCVPEVHLVRTSQLDQHVNGFPGVTGVPSESEQIFACMCRSHSFWPESPYFARNSERRLWLSDVKTLFGNQLFGAFNA